MSVKMALLANFLSALSCFIGLFIGIEVGQQGEVRLWFFAIAGGIFLYVALVDMVWHSILSQFVIYTLDKQLNQKINPNDHLRTVRLDYVQFQNIFTSHYS